MSLDIGVDIDNVIYPWTSVITRWIERQKGLHPGRLDDYALSWTWYKDQWGMSSEEFLGHFTDGVHAGVIFAEGDPEPGSLAALWRIYAAGHRIHYVTNRAIAGVTERHAWTVTHRWLHDHGFPVTTLTIAEDKYAVRTDVFLDDAPQNVQALIDAGHPHPLLWDRPHNQHQDSWHETRGGLPRRVKHPGRRRYPVRVHDWHGFERVVRTVAGPTEVAEDHDTVTWAALAPNHKDVA